MQIADVEQDATAYAIIRDLDQAWTDLIRLQHQFATGRFHSYEDRYNSVGYMQTAQRSIARYRAELDAHRAQRDASEERVTRLADVARDTGLLKAAAVAYLVYGPTVLPPAGAPALAEVAQTTFTPAPPDDPPWLPTLAEEARLDRLHFDREYNTEPDND